MTNHLKISDSFSLPLDAVTRRMAILAMSGAGKSSTAVRMAEEMWRAGLPWIAIDAKGDWPGIRAAGKGPGLPVPIFGGLHGDVPLEPKAGAFIANLIVERRLTCVLDVSEFEQRQEMWLFLADLGETLLRRNRQPLHVFCEEADEYLPQTAAAGGHQPRCLGVWQRVVKKGRTRGLGTTQITQRSAALNKDTLYQAELLIALRTGGEGDRKAIRGAVDHSGMGKEIYDSLPSLADGEGWLSSPAWLKRTERMRFLPRTTFDMGATPVLSGGAVPATTLAEVDLGAIRKAMADTIERIKQEDPTELRAELARVRAQVKELEARGPRQVQVPAITDAEMLDLSKLATQVDEAERHLDELAETLNNASHNILEMLTLARRDAMDRLDDTASGDAPTLTAKPAAEPRNYLLNEQHTTHTTRTAAAAERKATKLAGIKVMPPQKEWDPVEEEQYQKWKARLLAELKQEAPALLKVAATASEVEVAVEVRVVETSDTTLKGRVAKLVALGFFDVPRGNGTVRGELKRTGKDVNTGNLSTELHTLVSMGILTNESSGFVVAPGAKVRIKKVG